MVAPSLEIVALPLPSTISLSIPPGISWWMKRRKQEVALSDKMTNFIFLLLMGIHSTAAVTHSLKYFYTASSGVPNFPSYVSVGLVDDVQISYCDSNINRNIPKQEWMKKVDSEHPRYWREETQTCRDKQETFRKNLDVAKSQFNQTEGLHIYQQMIGCEWDDETEEVSGYDQFGYDGEDLIMLDRQIQTWIAPKQQALITINKWNNDRYAAEYEKSYLTQICVEWLKKYLNYGRSSLFKTGLPSVSFLQKSSSSPVSCHATGFYPDRAEMFWRKDGEEVHDGVVKGEILPNNDGTFQMSVDIDLSSNEPEDWNKYECVFQLSGVKEDAVHRLEKTRMNAEMNPESNGNMMIIPVVVAVAVLVLIGVVGFIIYEKKNAKRPPSPVENARPPEETKFLPEA